MRTNTAQRMVALLIAMSPAIVVAAMFAILSLWAVS